jgi:Mg-chelatase subunit ChlD/ribosomal protein L7/L12
MTDKLLNFSATLDRYQLSAGQPRSELSCQVCIEPADITGDASVMATTVSICLVFDCSSSMRGKRFEAAVETAKMIVDILHERHSISLVAFQSESHIVFKNALPTEGEKGFIKEQIDSLHSYLGGSTNMAAGIENGMQVLAEGTADAAIMVILSDGEPLFVERAQMAAEVASQKGIQIYAVGIGESYNADQLLQLVTPSNGAVFGDSDVDKISAIFFDLVNRIDRIFATNVKLNVTFDEKVQLKQVFKTSPERALYDSSTINRNDNSLELRVGNIECDKVYEFLLQIEIGGLGIGAKELLRASVQYDINHLGLNGQVQEIILTANSAGGDTLPPGKDKKIEDAQRSASMLQLGDELVQACSNSDNEQALQAIDELQQRCNEEDNTGLQQHLDGMKSQLASGGKVSDKDRNDFLLASTTAPPKVSDKDPNDCLPASTTAPPKVDDKDPKDCLPASTTAPPRADIFDLVLIDPGPETIRLLREIRNATKMGLREISDIIQCRNSVITVFKNQASAEKLQQRLIKIGAKVEVQAREDAEEDKQVLQ